MADETKKTRKPRDPDSKYNKLRDLKTAAKRLGAGIHRDDTFTAVEFDEKLNNLLGVAGGLTDEQITRLSEISLILD